MARHGLERGHIGASSDRLDPGCGSDDSHLEASPMSYEFHTSKFSTAAFDSSMKVRRHVAVDERLLERFSARFGA